MYWRAVLVIFLATFVFAKVDYTGHQVLRITPSSEVSLRTVYKIIESFELDLWSEEALGGIDVRVPPEAIAKLHSLLASLNIPYHVTIPDVQMLIDRESESVYGPRVEQRYKRTVNSGGRPTSPPRHIVDETLPTLFNTIETVPRHGDINDWIDNLADLLPEIAYTEVIGHSWENRPLKVITIGKPRHDGKPKKLIFVDAGIHAREWITETTALFMIYQLMSKHGVDPNITTLVETFDWCFLPVVNPDGYEYSHLHERLWRKTRSYFRPDHPRHDKCIGTDANRNFDYHWRNDTYHCTYSYSGPRPFSEPETRALEHYMLARKHDIIMYLSLHSNIKMWLTPWGHTKEQPHDHEDILRVANAATKAIKSVHGLSFATGSISHLLRNTVYGSSIDWAKGKAGIKYSFAPELRGRNDYYYNFMVTREEIIPAGEETWAAVEAAVQEIIKIENIEMYTRPVEPVLESVSGMEMLPLDTNYMDNLMMGDGPVMSDEELLAQEAELIQALLGSQGGSLGADESEPARRNTTHKQGGLESEVLRNPEVTTQSITDDVMRESELHHGTRGTHAHGTHAHGTHTHGTQHYGQSHASVTHKPALMLQRGSDMPAQRDDVTAEVDEQTSDPGGDEVNPAGSLHWLQSI